MFDAAGLGTHVEKRFFFSPGENQPLEKMRKEERIIPITEECALDPRLGYI